MLKIASVFSKNTSHYKQLVRSRITVMPINTVENEIKKKLKKTFSPVHVEVLNESYMHNVPRGSETHFKVVVVSDQFQNQPLIQRHRAINELLKEELQNGVHALSIEAKTPSQWENSTKIVEPSPTCLGGFGK